MRRIGWPLALLLVLGLGCSDDDDKMSAPEPSPEYAERTSPGAVLENLALAYRLRDIDAYTDQLDSGFVFIPNPADPEVFFDELRFVDDVLGTRNMFEHVDNISLDLTYAPGEGTPSDFAEYPAADGYRQILVQSVRMDVTTRELIGGEPLILQVAGDPATFIFKPSVSGADTTWRIAYQQDDG